MFQLWAVFLSNPIPYTYFTTVSLYLTKPILFYKLCKWLCLFQSPESVKVICKQGQFKASVLFSSPLNEPYDLAVLSVGKITGLKQLTLANKPAVVGNPIQKINNLRYFFVFTKHFKTKVRCIFCKTCKFIYFHFILANCELD